MALTTRNKNKLLKDLIKYDSRITSNNSSYVNEIRSLLYNGYYECRTLDSLKSLVNTVQQKIQVSESPSNITADAEIYKNLLLLFQIYDCRIYRGDIIISLPPFKCIGDIKYSTGRDDIYCLKYDDAKLHIDMSKVLRIKNNINIRGISVYKFKIPDFSGTNPHPHVHRDHICTGNAEIEIIAATLKFNFVYAVSLIQQSLTCYNDRSSYKPIKNFSGARIWTADSSDN